MSIGIGVSLVNFAAVISSVPGPAIIAFTATPATAPSIPANAVAIHFVTAEATYVGFEFWKVIDGYATRFSYFDPLDFGTNHDFTLNSASVDAGYVYGIHAVYGTALSEDLTTILGSHTTTVIEFLVDEVAAALTLPTSTGVTLSKFTPRVTTDTATGLGYYVAVANGDTAPSSAQIVAGLNNAGTAAIASGSKAAPVDATIVIPKQILFDEISETLLQNTQYDVYYCHVNLAGRKSNVPAVHTLTTVALLLDLANVTPRNDGFGYVRVTTNGVDGNIYVNVLTNAGTATNAQLVAGSGGNIVAGHMQSVVVTAPGVYRFAMDVGLTTGTNYDVVFVHKDALGAYSAQVKVDVLTTSISTDPYFDKVVALIANENANNGSAFSDQSFIERPVGKTGAPFFTNFQVPSGMTWAVAAQNDGDTMTLATSADFAFGTGDFTIESYEWCGSAGFPLLWAANDGTVSHFLFLLFSGQMRYRYDGATDVISSGSLVMTPGNWYHVELSRVSGTTRLFVAGVQVGSDYADTNNYLASNFSIPGNSVWYVSSFRVTKGVGRHSAGFTPPTLPLPTGDT